MSARKKTPTGKNAKPPRVPLFRRPTFYKLLSVLLLLFSLWVIYLDAQVRYKFEGKRWALPAQVYARALEIFDGRALNLGNLEQELALLQYRRQPDASAPGTYSVQRVSGGHKIVLYIRAHQLPHEHQDNAAIAFELQGDVVTRLVTLHGEQKALYTVEPFKMAGIYPGHKEERELLGFDQLPQPLIQALLVTEDRDFFEHFGVSPFSILRALWENFRAGKVVQGGSTLTQQLVKNFYLTRERSLWRKLNEAIMSVLLEMHYSKQDILETYANDIYLGQSGATAVHGFGMASYFYFGKALEHCEVQELALLVAMIKGPSYYDPRRHPERARERRDLVLDLMLDNGELKPYPARLARATALGVVDKPKIQTNRYPAFLDLVKRQLQSDYLEEDLRTEGLKIYTTLDPQLQVNLERASGNIMPGLAQRNGEDLQLGAVVTGVGTGEVLAMLGDRNPRYQGFNRALDARRQIGSLIKPAVYLSALKQPEKYHLASTQSDQAFKIEFENGDEWQPKNFDGEVREQVSLLQALTKSYNVATARLGLELGVDAVHETLKQLGVEQALNPYPSIFLGAQSLSPFEVSKFYQTIASNGFNMPLRAIREVTTSEGELLSRYAFDIRQVLPAQSVYLLQFAMQETMRSGTGRSAYRRLPAALHVAGKTGTTNDNRDSWFAGFSGDYLGVVWVGKDNNDSTHLTGSSGALRVWTDFMARIPQYPLVMQSPKDIAFHWFDQESWSRTEERCKGAMPLPIWGEPKGLPYQSCSQRQGSWKGWFEGWF